MNKKYKRYLDNLRASGETNMYGAPAYLEEVFGLTKAKAREVVTEWMRTFGK